MFFQFKGAVCTCEESFEEPFDGIGKIVVSSSTPLDGEELPTPIVSLTERQGMVEEDEVEKEDGACVM